MEEPCTTGIDLDGDGYGTNCPMGGDCDDLEPMVHDNCDSCTGDEVKAGCPCKAGTAPLACFQGTSAQAMTPPCQAGIRHCSQATSLWGQCEGEVPPEDEVCDGKDNNCDGTKDEGVLSKCGTCDPACENASGGDPTPFPLTDDEKPANVVDLDADGVGLNSDGDLVLDSSQLNLHYLWVANASEGTVSKIDSETGKEVARYASVTRDAKAVVDLVGAGTGGVPAWNPSANGTSDSGNLPSRTSVDFFGDVWVANRAPSAQPSATKIWNDQKRCVDRNGNGRIDTSVDVSGDGRITLTNSLEYYGEADECIAFTVLVGRRQAGWWGARALAVDAGSGASDDPGDVWVGMFEEQAFYQLSGKTGALLRRVPASGGFNADPAVRADVKPYGAAIDSRGHLWIPNNCCNANGILEIDTADGRILGNRIIQAGVVGGSYGIAIDRKDRVWLGGWPHAAVLRYDPVAKTWAQAAITTPPFSSMGVRGVGVDVRGKVWAALHLGGNYRDGGVARVDADTMMVTGTWDIIGEVPVGVGVDAAGHVWTINQNSSNASRLFVNPVSGEPAAGPSGNMVDVFPVGRAPYTYSDFTGIGLRTVTRPSGTYTAVYNPCPGDSKARWGLVDFKATTPPRTRVELSVRTWDIDSTTAQSFGKWIVSPADLQQAPGPVPDSRFLELSLHLVSEDRESSPILHSYELQWKCPGVID
jgi:hypothetical protein